MIEKDDIVSSFSKYWISEFELKKRVYDRRIIRASIINIFAVNNNYVIIRYFRYGIIPRIVKIKLNDIHSIKNRFKRKKYINNTEFLKITTLKHSVERRVLRNKTLMYKTLFIFMFLTIAALISFIMIWFI